MNASEIKAWKLGLAKTIADLKQFVEDSKVLSKELFAQGKKEERLDLHKKIREAEKLIELNEPLLGEKIYMSRYLYSDVDAYEVIKILTPNKFVVRELKATLTEKADKALGDSFVPGGFVGHFNNACQEWNFESDENGITKVVRRHKDGCYYEAGSKTIPFVPRATPYKFYDYNF